MSDTAKSGFETEDQVVAEFCDWENSETAKKWLSVMGYEKVETLTAKITRSDGVNPKADVVVKVNGDSLGISVKKFKTSFNQIDKRWVDNYGRMWGIPEDVITTLKKYCGQEPYRPMDEEPIPKVKDKRRYVLTELTCDEQRGVLDFFNKNESQIICDVLKGNIDPKADYVLVVEKNGKGLEKSGIATIQSVMEHYTGQATITKRGNLKLGKITIQRKGGDGGKKTAQMLQFKFSPKEVMEL